MTRACPQCGAREASVLASMDAATVVRGNDTYSPRALEILGLRGDERYSFVRCSTCGFVFARELPDATFLARLYGEVIDPATTGYTSATPAWIAHQLELAAKLVKHATGQTRAVRMLDYGCGDGTVVAALNAAGIPCDGFEPHPRSIVETARAHVRQTRDALRAPYDAILLSDVIEHLPDPIAILHDCHELLTDRGWIAVNVPDFGEARLDAILRGGTFPRDVNPWEHLNYFSPESLAAMLERAGIRVEPEPAPRFGLRGDTQGVGRIVNAMKSVQRMLRFVARPRLGTTTAFARKA
jgi:SAM-dependent methyltransferase